MEENPILKSIKSISLGSNKIAGWGITIIGGTLLTILNTDYLHPECTFLKLFYLLFIFGWICLSISINKGMKISGQSMAADFYSKDEEQLKEIFKKSNLDFASQLRYFKIGLLFLFLWLILYIIWWVFGYIPIKIK